MSSVMLVNADAGRIPLQDGVVHCSISSPPYFSLRQYTGDQGRDWPAVSYAPMPGLPALAVPPMRCALGLEPDVASFIGHLVLCYREVWRVLRDDGVMWVVIGDAYGHGTTAERKEGGAKQKTNVGANTNARHGGEPGQLLAVPYRLLLALQADNWIIRNDCVWQKIAPMPESVQGTRWQRHMVKVAKSERAQPGSAHYHSQDGINNPQGARDGVNFKDHSSEYAPCPGCPACAPHGGYVLRRGSWRHARSHETVIMATKGMGYWSDGEAVREKLANPNAADGSRVFGGSNKNGANIEHGERTTGRVYDNAPAGRNPRDVLTPRPESYPGQHYATFPRSLTRPLILASCPARCCSVCGAGWAAVVERVEMDNPPGYNGSTFTDGKTVAVHANTGNGKRGVSQSTGYRPTCEHDAASVPGLVLDPFAGTGTVLVEARALGRRGVGCDLSFDYLHDQARARLELDALDDWHEGNGMQAAETADMGPLFGGLK